MTKAFCAQAGGDECSRVKPFTKALKRAGKSAAAARAKPIPANSLLNTRRTVNILDCQGSKGQRNRVNTLTLEAGQGLRELKALIRQKFGTVPHTKLTSVTTEDGGKVDSQHIVDGMTLRCQYTEVVMPIQFMMHMGRGFHH